MAWEYSEHDKAYFKPFKQGRLFIKHTTHDLKVNYTIVRKKSFMVFDENDSMIYFIMRFPYERHTSIKALWYDVTRNNCGTITFSYGNIHMTTREKWLYSILLSCVKTGDFPEQCRPCNSIIATTLKQPDYSRMMQDVIRRHKHGTGGQIIMRHPENDLGNLRYKQNTEVAYWANLNNIKSGNASIIASNIR